MSFDLNLEGCWEAWCFPVQTYASKCCSWRKAFDAFGGLLPVSATPPASWRRRMTSLCREPFLFHPSCYLLHDASLGSSQRSKAPSPLHSNCTLTWAQIHCTRILFPVFCPPVPHECPWRQLCLLHPYLSCIAKGEAQNRGSVKELWVDWSCNIWGSPEILKTNV